MYEQMCPRFEQAMELLGKKWVGLIIRVLLGGPRRFCVFRQQLPHLTDRVLSDRLRELEEEGLVKRVVYDQKPVLIEYELTEKGRALEPVIAAVQDWAEGWCAGKGADASSNIDQQGQSSPLVKK